MNPSVSFPFSGAILAGGRSSRMERDKAFLPIAGQPLIARQAALLRSLGTDDLIISGRPDTDYAIPHARLVHDPIPDAGPLAGLVAVLSAAHHPWVLVLAVDLPHLTPAFLRSLLHSGAGRTGIVPRTAYGWEPLAALSPRTLLPAAEAALRSGRYSLQPFIDQAEHSGTIRRLLVPSENHALFTNWNSPEDLPASS